MGCCVSKCSPKNEFAEEEELDCVQDKLVISRYPRKVSPISLPDKGNPIFILDKGTPIPHKTTHFPPSPSKSTSFSSSLTCTTSNSTVNSSNSSLSCVSSTLSSKDRSFSNEFLQACCRENPHIVRINSIREASLSLTTTKPPSPQKFSSLARTISSPLVPPMQSNPNLQRGTNSSTLQKRVRSSSPNYSALIRQKSFRKEQERVVTSSSGRILRSPSPSRRFGMSGSKVSPIGFVALPPRQESFRPASPSKISSSPLGPSCLRNRETRIHRISSKIDETVVKEVISSQNESVPVEDIDNPLISLDCFIFL